MMSGDVPLVSEFWLPDRSGMKEDVYSAARAEWPWACNYVRTVLNDDSDAADLLQASAAAVSRALSRACWTPGMAVLRAYLRRAYIRRVWRLRKSRRREVPLETTDVALDNDIERHVLIEELSAFLDTGALQIFHYRVAGESWTSIAEKLRITSDAASARFYKGLDRVKRRVLRSYQPPPNNSS